ncbi:MAG: hypothetical protein SFV15_14945 [Polyangiaceae bacterium]|nr:hypothetical protein [Polyangiaceae bacterium]
MKLYGTLIGAILGTLVASNALAASAPETHDGFYMQLQGGLGYYSTSAETLGVKAEYSGATFATSFLLGGTPGAGLVVGGGMILDYGSSPTVEINGQEVPNSISSQYIVGIGPFVDYYPDPKGGLHFQLFPGWGGLESASNGNVGGSDPTGLVLSLGGGYEWWLSDQWSAGVLGRLIYAPLSMNDVDYTVVEPAVVASFTYH